jgi:hypothetical protein
MGRTKTVNNVIASMDNINHALEIYKALKNKEDVTKDISELYFAIVVLGDRVVKDGMENFELTL